MSRALRGLSLLPAFALAACPGDPETGEPCGRTPRPVDEGGHEPATGWFDRVTGAQAGEGVARARVTPERLVADRPSTFAVHLEVGSEEVLPGGGFAVRDPVFYGMRWAHYAGFTTDPALCGEGAGRDGHPQGLLTARAASGAPVVAYRENCSADQHRDMMTEVIAPDGLAPGDAVVLTFGDTGPTDLAPAGDPDCALNSPWRAYRRIDLRVAFRAAPTEAYRPLAVSPTLDVDPDPLPVYGAAILPSQAALGETVELRLVGLDARGNPSPGFTGTATCTDRLGDMAVPRAVRMVAPTGVAVVPATFTTAGVHWLDCEGPAGLRFTSNPIRVGVASWEPKVYWGDLHVHNGHGYKDGTGRWVDQNVAYARDVMALDFGATVPKAQPLEIDGESLWSRLQQVCRDEESAEFVPFLGYEWMGDTRVDGHHNVYFDSCEGAIADSREVAPLAEEGSLDDLLRPLGRHAVVFPHATRFTGHNWEVASEQRTAAEVFSAWGDSLLDPQDAGAVQQGLLRGHRLGFIASSDNHDGFMGNPLATFGDRGGLAALVAPERTREALFDALRERRSYATDGSRILLDFSAVDRIDLPVVEVPMGERYVGRIPTLRVAVHGTAPLAAVTVQAGRWPGESVEEVARWEPGGAWSLEETFDTWTGPLPFAADTFYYVQVEQQDGGRAWSSPIWIDHGCGDAGDPLGMCDDDGDGRSELEGDPDDATAASRLGGGCQSAPGGGAGAAAWLGAMMASLRFRLRTNRSPRSTARSVP